MTIHHSALEFGQVAAAYERGRPDYPAEAVDRLTILFAIDATSTVVDLAAGTGKLTRMLVPSGAHIVAVEPVAGMREMLLDQLTLSESTVDVRDGTAEALPLEDASVDAVMVAQAFHWFATDGALAEIHRVLRPGGGLALIWNRRDMDQPLQRAITEMVELYRGDTPAHRSGSWKAVFDRTNHFVQTEEWHIPHYQEVDGERLVDRVLSISFIAALPEPKKAEVREQVQSLAGDLPAQFLLRYITDVYVYLSTPHPVGRAPVVVPAS